MKRIGIVYNKRRGQVVDATRLNIAYLTAEDPQSKYAWSGTTYYMAHALEKYCGDVHFLGPILSFERRYIGRLMQEMSSRLLKKNIAYDRLLFVAKKQAKLAAQKLEQGHYDVIFSPIGPPEVAFLETNIPIVIATDVTFALQQNYHARYSNLLPFSARMGQQIEAMAYAKASALIYPSHWAARSAVEDYGVDEKKVHVLPFGANLDTLPTRQIALKRHCAGRCRLLFMGLGWERKGGDIAFETLLKLESMGIDTELIVCGCTPPKSVQHPRLIVIPFLNKHDEQQNREIQRLYATSHFLLVPTRCDCFPIVFNEANAFGLPVITSNTGGVPDAVHDGENGYVLPFEARGESYARLIAQIFQDEQRYKALAASSRAVFEQRHNWDAWGITMRDILQQVVAPVYAHV
jgi:glycosyltransferase involved in cell wall biosynthesis